MVCLVYPIFLSFCKERNDEVRKESMTLQLLQVKHQDQGFARICKTKQRDSGCNLVFDIFLQLHIVDTNEAQNSLGTYKSHNLQLHATFAPTSISNK